MATPLYQIDTSFSKLQSYRFDTFSKSLLAAKDELAHH